MHSKTVVPVIFLLLISCFIVISCSKGGNPISPSETGLSGSGLEPLNSALTPGLESDLIHGGAEPFIPIEEQPYAPDEILVVLEDGIVPVGDNGRPHPIAASAGEKFLDSHGLEIIKVVPLSWAIMYRLRIVDGTDVPEKVSKLEVLPEIRYAEPNYRVEFCEVPWFPNDPLWENPNDGDDDPRSIAHEQFGPSKTGASVVWNETAGNPSVVVCVIDTGIQWWHEDLENVMWVNAGEIPENDIDDDLNGYIDDIYGWDPMDDDWDIMDPSYGSSHGTGCAGVVATEMDNNLGCAGMAPGCRIMGIRIGFTSAFYSAVIEGTQYAMDNGASVISMSFISTYPSPLMRNTMEEAYDEGMILVAGAGNDEGTPIYYPASWPFIVKVGATSPFKQRWSYTPFDEVRISTAAGFGWGSTYGNGQEVMAFGEHYITTRGANDHSYFNGVNDRFFGGTSNATPMVAGGFALLKSVIPDQTSEWYRIRMRRTSDDLHESGYDEETGWGRMNLIRACYGSDRYAEFEDGNGFVDLGPLDNSIIDSIHNVTVGDYGEYVDPADLYKVTADRDGTLLIHLDIYTWGENLDLEIFNDLTLTPESLVDSSYAENHAFSSNEVCFAACNEGETLYIRVTGAESGDSSAYILTSEVIDDYFTLENNSYDPGFIHLGGSGKLLGYLDFETGSRAIFNYMALSVQGDMPAEKITLIQLWRDANANGTFQSNQDKLVATGDFKDTNRAVFSDFVEEINFPQNPARFFIRANFSGINEDAQFTLSLTSYKDIGTVEGKEIHYTEFPRVFGPYEVGVDILPPTWDTTVGIQASVPMWEGAVIKWNSASDTQTPPVDYNVYWTQELPFDFDFAEHSDDVVTVEDDDFDHAWTATGLNGGEEYFIAVRAQDQAGNEEENTVYMAVYPWEDHEPPTWDTTVGIQAAEPLHHGAFLSWNSASDNMTEPVDFNVYWTQELPFVYSTADVEYAVEHWDGTDYNHVWRLDDLTNDQEYFVSIRGQDQAGNEEENEVYLAVTPAMVGHPGSPIILGSVNTANAWEVEIDPVNNRAFVADSNGGVGIIDISDPENPDYLEQVPAPGVYGVFFDGTLIYAATGNGLMIIDPYGIDGAEVLSIKNTGDYLDVCVVGDWAYLTDYGNGLSTFDVTDPTDPQSYPSVTSGSIGYGMDAQDGFLYIATNSKPRVFDLADPSAPVLVKTFGSNGAYEIDAMGDRLYVTYWSARRFMIYSLDDPANPVWLGTWISDSGYGGSDIVYLHDHLYFGTNNHYIEVLNVDDPENIFEVGQVSTDGPDGLNTDGVFIYSAENTDGLKIIL